MNKKKIGVFGGAFDPVHNGHLALATSAKEELGLDHVMFVPTAYPIHRHSAIASFDERLFMLRSAVAELPWAAVSSIEKELPAPSITIRTLKALHNPSSQLYLIMGADQANLIRTWEDWDDIPKYARMVTCGNGLQWHADKEAFDLIYPPALEISSTGIRERVKNNQSLIGLVPPVVIEYIYKRRLYEGQ
jgi:nicotinate-nucleotide adenylyltransferase